MAREWAWAYTVLVIFTIVRIDLYKETCIKGGKWLLKEENLGPYLQVECSLQWTLIMECKGTPAVIYKDGNQGNWKLHWQL